MPSSSWTLSEKPGSAWCGRAESDPGLAERIWRAGQGLGFGSTFVDGVADSITDDHVPFRELGLRAVDLIPVEGSDSSPFFPWHHTTLDTLDHVSRESLGRVGATLEKVLETPVADPESPQRMLKPGLIAGAVAAGGVVVILLGGRRRRRRAQRARGVKPARQRRRAASRRRGS